MSRTTRRTRHLFLDMCRPAHAFRTDTASAQGQATRLPCAARRRCARSDDSVTPLLQAAQRTVQLRAHRGGRSRPRRRGMRTIRVSECRYCALGTHVATRLPEAAPRSAQQCIQGKDQPAQCEPREMNQPHHRLASCDTPPTARSEAAPHPSPPFGSQDRHNERS